MICITAGLSIAILLAASPIAAAVETHTPTVVLKPLGIPVTLSSTLPQPLQLLVRNQETHAVLFSGTVQPDSAGVLPELNLHPQSLGKLTLEFTINGQLHPAATQSVRVLPGWISLLPPLLAIGLAIALRQVIVALFAGLWIGCLFMFDFNPLTATLRAVDQYILGRMMDSGNASLLLFTLLLGGMVGVIGRSGGAQGIAQVVTRFATTRRRGQFATWFLGLIIFFDDYANSLLVGPTMRPITDRLRISREKLAFIVDGTSAPVASIALISSWIGVEVGYINSEFQSLGIERDAYWVFVQTLPYRFYPFLMLFFVALIIFLRRDFGPMHQAEVRAQMEGKLLRDGATPATDFTDSAMAPIEGRPKRWINAAVPLLTVLLTVLLGLYVDGRASVLASGDDLSLRNIIGSADSFKALLWASFFGSAVAILMAVGGRVLSLNEAMQAWATGLKSMLYALIILVLSWSLGEICKSDLKTGDYLVNLLGPSLKPALLPVMVFLVAAFTSFATGSSWGTMGILFPLVVPLAHGLVPGDLQLLLGSISGILAGSVWGDHCSPLSDTTILSSLASSCDHVDHVRTQIPYVVVVALVSIVLGDLATGFGLYGPWVGMLLGGAALVGIAYFLGKRTPERAGNFNESDPTG